MFITRFFVWITILICISSAANSQPTLLARPAPAPEYALGPGDQIAIHVIDLAELSDKPTRVDPNGYIDLPLAGRFKASGLTLEQFKSELASRIGKYITNPQISVGLTDNQNRNVSVIGAVRTPGVHELQGPRRLVEVLSLAGGVDAAAGPRIIITREQKWGRIPLPSAVVDLATGGSTAWVPLDDLMSSKNPSDNILVFPNDIVSVPKAEIVYVLGNVKKAGGFQLSSHQTISLTQVLSLAEGMDKDASGSHAKILRPSPGGDGKPTEIPVNISQIFAGKSLDIPLQGNDVLYVPGSEIRSGSRRAVDAIIQAATGLAIYRF